MTVRNLERIFRPSSVALVGASARPQSVGNVTARNLLAGGFQGPIAFVNPRGGEVEGVACVPDVASLPFTPDLAVLAIPPDAVLATVAALGERGTKGVIVITAGFEGSEGEGAARRLRLLQAAQPHLLRIVGPNCVGVIVPGIGLNASFAQLMPPTGDIAFVTQSGAIATSVLDWAAARGIGFSHVVSVGNMADVDFGDVVDYLGGEPGVRSILLYVEAVTHARKFMSALRAAARVKPVVAIKAGRHEEGARAASSHTGALAGADAVYDAAFRRAGLLRVRDLDELFDAVETLVHTPRIAGERLAILTNGGGIGVLATDRLIDLGGRLAALAPETVARLDAVLPATWSRGNPIDIIGDADGRRYAQAVEAVLEDPGVDALLVLNCPVAVASGLEAAEALVGTLENRPTRRVSVLASWLGESSATDARALLASRRIASYATPSQAVRGFMHLVRYRRNQELLMQTPPSLPGPFAPDAAAVRGLLAAALEEGREWLSEPAAKELLAAYAIPVVETRLARDAAEAARLAEGLGGAVALKIVSPEITHKSDVGGVVLDLEGGEAVRQAAEAMTARVRARRPDARLAGFSVQRMVRRARAHELIMGVVDDPTFGPVLLFGQGGTAVEVIADKALGLPPLNLMLAREMMERTRVWRLLQGYRDRPPADLDALALTLVKLSQLVVDHAEIVELDINPLLADETGVVALDARVRVARPARPGQARLAIRPYPQELERRIALDDGTPALLRPIRPEDEPAILEALRRMTPEDIRMRFFTTIKEFSHAFVARLTQIDYDREMALVAIALAAGPDGRMVESDGLGVVRLSADPDGQRAEFAVTVASGRQRRGIGRLLMEAILDYARRRGIRRVFGEVLRENERMLALAAALGFAREPSSGDPSVVRVRLDLGA